nr:M48 family metallopeptidase [Deinococcus geothermalis]
MTNTETRWGSCTAGGVIRLHWALARAPREVVRSPPISGCLRRRTSSTSTPRPVLGACRSPHDESCPLAGLAAGT